MQGCHHQRKVVEHFDDGFPEYEEIFINVQARQMSTAGYCCTISVINDMFLLKKVLVGVGQYQLLVST